VLPQAWHQIVEIAGKPGFAQAVTEMRKRLQKSNRYTHSFKLARGGFYDIDFLVAYLMLRSASPAQGNTLDRLAHLHTIGALDRKTFDDLDSAASLYRTTDHVIRLVTGRALPQLPEAERARAIVEKLVNAILDRDPKQELQAQLDETAINARKIFEQVFVCS
jgi:glutamine synthetase adenylyltransferase